jgi:riboflavin kinase/FMN adenylyltransferase
VQLIADAATWPNDVRGGAVAIGNFDGVHRGHARIIAALREQAAAVGGPAIVFTFDPHPVRLLRPAEAPPPLTWTQRKAELLAALGVEAMIAYPTDRALLQHTAEEFFRTLIVDRLAARAMVEGPNFRFGARRAGDVAALRTLCDTAHVRLEIVEPLVEGGEIVSSSRIRRLVAEGAVDAARQLLTEPYRIRGLVVHGAGRGNSIGFPTANIAAVDTLAPGLGVYAARAWLRDAAAAKLQSWPAAVNIGANPTFGESAVKIEAHLIGCNQSLYGEVLEVDFLARLRDIQPFADVQGLQAQLKHDVAASLQIAERH